MRHDGLDHARIMLGIGIKIAHVLSDTSQYGELMRQSEKWPVVYSGEHPTQLKERLDLFPIGENSPLRIRGRKKPYDAAAKRNKLLLHHLMPMLRFYAASPVERDQINQEDEAWFNYMLEERRQEKRDAIRRNEKNLDLFSQVQTKWWTRWQHKISEKGFPSYDQHSVGVWADALWLKIDDEYPLGPEVPPWHWAIYPLPPSLAELGASLGRSRAAKAEKQSIAELKNPTKEGLDRLKKLRMAEAEKQGTRDGIKHQLKIALSEHAQV